ncbi:hypothetical protein DpV83gp036 [Deerpox virus W-848-83]|uniref:Uncharacterized protein n=1 Tax=Deerpox virus (strain Mule deer/United States/W-848-83/1983) TaxID=305674 RepID=Q08FW5_DPV83|nr:hypothetical protein DpV83gp036 [Deerpox virus W-848-83]ABI99192.1 hypothetical protein DpV83gp036 [Deerpox virus W-848-83]
MISDIYTEGLKISNELDKLLCGDDILNMEYDAVMNIISEIKVLIDLLENMYLLDDLLFDEAELQQLSTDK